MRVSLHPSVPPVVSVIIPCYNHGKFLGESIESVLKQSYTHHEIIVVNDGSKDDTREVANGYPSIRYIYQKNQGLSAARNTGISESTGHYLVFLDADDWLFPDALAVHVASMMENPELAFVSGAHQKVNAKNELLEARKTLHLENYYQAMLRGNYIEMHATVMYARWVFDMFRFDVLLKACEDYDLYLKIVRRYPVAHNNHLTAAYRFHNQNMSGNSPLMLRTALEALGRQYETLANEKEKQNWRSGMRFYKNFYCNKMFENIFSHSGARQHVSRDFFTLLKHPATFTKCLSSKLMRRVKKMLIRLLPFFILKRLHKAGMHKNFIARS